MVLEAQFPALRAPRAPEDEQEAVLPVHEANKKFNTAEQIYNNATSKVANLEEALATAKEDTVIRLYEFNEAKKVVAKVTAHRAGNQDRDHEMGGKSAARFPTIELKQCWAADVADNARRF